MPRMRGPTHRQLQPRAAIPAMFALGRPMLASQEQPANILVIEYVEETRYGIKRLLSASGYQVGMARDEEEAVVAARILSPDLILISLGMDAPQALPFAGRIRERAGLGEGVPVVVFSVASLEEGAEVGAGCNVYLTRPENFDRIRSLIGRLLQKSPPHV
jgi:CheY-like chemotaxis protein